jgi:hypothetical protein
MHIKHLGQHSSCEYIRVGIPPFCAVPSINPVTTFIVAGIFSGSSFSSIKESIFFLASSIDNDIIALFIQKHLLNIHCYKSKSFTHFGQRF